MHIKLLVMSKESVVISIGGSILIPDEDDAVYIGKLSKMLLKVSKTVKLAVICGGGKIARYYANTGRDLGGNEDQLDLLGIGATRLNAGLLALSLGSASSTDIPTDVDTAAERSASVDILVMGGTKPGHTTDAVAAMLAKEMHAARVVNATSVDAVYSADPRMDPNAVRYDTMTVDQLGDLVYKDHGAGKSSVFDPLGVKIAKKEHIDIMMVDGRDLDDLEKAILGKPFSGTFVNSH